MDFQERYNSLNDRQREAVDTIDGPVMVIAGPGTGKTELLSMRVANILKKTDILPENILCLTYTDNGADAMRRRLLSIIGQDAYKVAIHTFHSFGTEIISTTREYFYRGATFSPADSVQVYEIIRNILKKLPLSDPLSSLMNGEYTYQRDVTQVIGELKKSGLTNDELLDVLDSNDEIIDRIEQILAPIAEKRVSDKVKEELIEVMARVNMTPADEPKYEIPSLQTVMVDQLALAINEADTSGKNTPISAWKAATFERSNGQLVLKSRARQKKLRSVARVYQDYVSEMEKASLFDYDDMILQIVHAIETNEDLRFNLQEKYQYLLVDEFQDTNLAQMRILHNLTNNPVNEGRPNIFVVGDDDQAIYSFQGADISNILNFNASYPATQRIVLKDNYRSAQAILDSAREIIVQGSNRLEDSDELLDKSLIADSKEKSSPKLIEHTSISNERYWLAGQIKKLINSGTKPSEIAVLLHKHSEIQDLLPYLSRLDIAVSYERRDNVLELEPIVLLEKIGRFISALSSNRHDEANGLLPEILAHPAWNISSNVLWKLSSLSYDQRKRWIDTMESIPELTSLRSWFVELSVTSSVTTLESIIDKIIGTPSEIQGEFVSPLYEYFFSEAARKSNPTEYISFIEGLRIIRQKLKEYHPNEPSNLASFISFIELHRRVGDRIQITTTNELKDSAIRVMTAHSSKGLEFDHVFVANVTDNQWGEKVKGANRKISYPDNLALAPNDHSYSERLRLFYVACTRARHSLTISYSVLDHNNKPTLAARFLAGQSIKAEVAPANQSIDDAVTINETAWYQRVLQPSIELRDVLALRLETYRLSASHLNAFLDVTRGGPEYFLTRYLLHFPGATSSHAAYGLAVHTTLEQAHSHFNANGVLKPIEDILIDFEMNLLPFRMETVEFDGYLQKGSDELSAYLTTKQQEFTNMQKPELNFSHQQSQIDDVRLNGTLDLSVIDPANKTFQVFDYKTGKPADNWKGRDESEKIKLHKYRQQLMFYKLLVENSRDYHDYTVASAALDFVEPMPSGQIVSLQLEFDSDELARFKQLVSVVWQHIINVNLPDISGYDMSLKGILEFEQDLIDDHI